MFPFLKGDSVMGFSTHILVKKKTLPLPHMNRPKRFREIFCFGKDICENLRPRSCRLRPHGVRIDVRVAVDYADTVSA